MSEGSYSLTAVATDNEGANTSSSSVNITVESPAPNEPPTVTLTDPAEGTKFNAPADITLSADATDADGNIQKVEFLVDGAVVGEDVDGGDGWGINWQNVEEGNYVLSARATDNDDAATASQSVNIFVQSAPTIQPPNVLMLTPTEGQQFEAPVNIQLTASAAATGGSVKKVEFFQGTTKLGEDRDGSDGWSMIWQNVDAGNYSLTTKATDTKNSTNTSGTTSINVVHEDAGEALLNVPGSLISIDSDASDWTNIFREPVSQHNIGLAPPSSESDNSSNYSIAWDNNNLYVYANVKDDEFDITGSNRIWRLDGIEILIDGRNNKSASFEEDDHQILIQADGNRIEAEGYSGGDEIRAMGTQLSDGYSLEVAVSWSFINGNAPTDGQSYGFLLVVNDRDNEALEHQMMWRYAANHSKKTAEWGTIVLDGQPPSAISTEDSSTIPEAYGLDQNFPNPFQGSTTLSFDVPITSNVELSVFDIAGRLVARLLNETVTTGTHQVVWNGRGLAGGIYIIRMQTEESVLYRRATVLK